ncbi:hypothetical protein NLU13_2616 [Sarocladium strictum]|uniref:DUF8004 domain-containing protein n=1 Tax=Sarocladium strictum TaxID=5046 RepID=A0AA39GKI4_SARSR|nr:hypothetical protein NLU13_2616 [Sarocladium strictum]
MATAYMAPQGRRMGAFLDRRAIGAVKVKRWDGVSRSCGEWDCLRRDPELWFRDGNCLVHLYGKGHSKRGPSFKVPFSALIDAQCFPLIARFLSTDGHRPRTPQEMKRLERTDPSQTIDLYVAPGALANKEQTLQYHLATRNLFAWVFGLPLVGVHLGQALIGLLNSMHEFRSGLGDNVSDLMEYFERAGYLRLTGSPDHALALAHFAEHFQMRDLYVRAMAHCVGMNERLHFSSEYLYIDQSMKKLLRLLRKDMDDRMFRASDTLRNFLDDELSDTYVGLPSGPRAHLERFRSFLMGYYTKQLGYYPPRLFDSNLLRMMREDFEALYELLVDNGYDTSQPMPTIAVGGICILQLVQDFDKAHDHKPIEHPLPLLPHVQEMPSVKRMNWLPRGGRTKPDQRLLEHTALIKATNWKREFFTNELVCAYRKFEEDTILAPKKTDKQEKVSLIDARKVRWLVVYAVYQVLKNVTEEPAEVQDDMDAAYHLSISTGLLPVWEHKHELGFLIRSQTDMVRTSSLVGTRDTRPQMVEFPEPKIEIKPDIDYFALTHKDEPGQSKGGLVLMTGSAPLTRSNSLSKALSLTKRRSMMFFKSTTGVPPVPSHPYLRPVHQEIVVPGYGNGMNEVQLDEKEPVPSGSWASRSDSTASKTPSNVESVFDRTDGTDEYESEIETPSSSVKSSSPDVTYGQTDNGWDAMPAPLNVRSKRRDVVSMIIPSIPPRRGTVPRPLSAVLDLDAAGDGELSTDSSTVDLSSPSLPHSSSFLQRKATKRLSELRRRSFVPTTGSKRTSESNEDNAITFVTDEKAEWASMQSWLDGDRDRLEVSGRNGNGDSWGQYAELGGLTETK